MVDLGPFKESMGRYIGYIVLLGGIIIALNLLVRKTRHSKRMTSLGVGQHPSPL